ncbi:hypothetical protein ANN_06910 [Periplaneta americana]|uniref:Uncharacterized protein n=1 Tax=Periplaneta americana TaxID=6978 RepID=A0ABQ8TGL3_PERAM|nr:hypothetical protein ANN_06910 [Periplaneta americana]
MIMSRDENIVRNGNIKIGNLSFEEVEKFKYLGATVTNINDTREEIKHRIKFRDNIEFVVISLEEISVQMFVQGFAKTENPPLKAGRSIVFIFRLQY